MVFRKNYIIRYTIIKWIGYDLGHKRELDGNTKALFVLWTKDLSTQSPNFEPVIRGNAHQFFKSSKVFPIERKMLMELINKNEKVNGSLKK